MMELVFTICMDLNYTQIRDKILSMRPTVSPEVDQHIDCNGPPNDARRKPSHGPSRHTSPRSTGSYIPAMDSPSKFHFRNRSLQCRSIRAGSEKQYSESRDSRTLLRSPRDLSSRNYAASKECMLTALKNAASLRELRLSVLRVTLDFITAAFAGRCFDSLHLNGKDNLFIRYGLRDLHKFLASAVCAGADLPFEELVYYKTSLPSMEAGIRELFESHGFTIRVF